jgi:glycosyltransferase involved in cell wall biosynthesis
MAETLPMTTISVVMGVYNGAATLRPTLDSILAQTYGDFECIVVDDGSADDTQRVLADYAARDSRFRIIRQENAGLTRALIAGCGVARGEYIARHDAGDRSHPERFRIQVDLLGSESRLALVSCATDFIGPRDEYLFTSHPDAIALRPVEMIDVRARHGIMAGPSHHGSAMFRRDAYERAGAYRAAFYYGQDWDLWYRLGAIGLFQSIDQPLYTARVTPDSISGSSRKAQHALAALSLRAMLARSRGESDAEIVAEAARIRDTKALGRCGHAQGLYFIGEALRRNGDARARAYLRDTLRACPLLLKAWIRYAQVLMR